MSAEPSYAASVANSIGSTIGCHRAYRAGEAKARRAIQASLRAKSLPRVIGKDRRS
jgi:hypothetical protein